MPKLRIVIAGYAVHLYTLSGGVLGMLALLYAADGEIRTTFILLGITVFIDATDGMLARRVKVTEATPNFSGAQLDDAVDVLNYIFVPVFVMAREGLLPHPWWVIIPIVAALYAYGQVNMKTDDNFFKGFPSYWNVVALYMYWFRPGALVAVLMVLFPAILTFIPTRYLYPSKNSMFWKTSWILGFVWCSLCIYILLQPEPSRTLVWLSLFYPAYYLTMSFYADWKIRHAAA